MLPLPALRQGVRPKDDLKAYMDPRFTISPRLSPASAKPLYSAAGRSDISIARLAKIAQNPYHSLQWRDACPRRQASQMNERHSPIAVVLALALGMALQACAAPSLAEATPAQPPSAGMGAASRDPLQPAALPPNPNPAQRGELDDYMNCVPCHGDVGQGLTDAWR
jgi:hypothetical protein